MRQFLRQHAWDFYRASGYCGKGATYHDDMTLCKFIWVISVWLGVASGLAAEPLELHQAPAVIAVGSTVDRGTVRLPYAWNLLRVKLRADVNRRNGLSAVLAGSQSELEVRDLKIYRNRITNTLVMTVISLCVSALAFWLWLTQPAPLTDERRDPLYLLMGVNALAWAIGVSEAIIETPLFPWPWWGVFTMGAYVVWVVFTFLFCHQVLKPVRLWGWALAMVCLVSGILAVYFALRSEEAWGWQVLSTWLGAVALWSVGYVVWYFRRTWVDRHTAGQADRLVIGGAMMLALIAGFCEWLDVNPSSDFYNENSVTQYISLLFGMAFIFIVANRFRTASEQSRDLTHHLALRVAQREKELAISYGEMEQLARDQSSTAERVRILRDLHDGVGSHISTAIRQLESGQSRPGEVLQTLRDSLDQLKLSIDAMNLPPGDINALLANIRYRLEPRFLACNIPWHWNVNLLEPVSRLDASAMRQLQFMLFEALSNVLQHAQASVLQIAASPLSSHGTGVMLQIIDNGLGFDLSHVQRRGLQSMQDRAHAIGVTLNLTSVPGRTVVEIRIE